MVAHSVAKIFRNDIVFIIIIIIIIIHYLLLLLLLLLLLFQHNQTLNKWYLRYFPFSPNFDTFLFFNNISTCLESEYWELISVTN